MSSMTDISEASATEFAQSAILLYRGPCVKIRVIPSNNKYMDSKHLLCRDSEYFSAMFTGEYKEEQEQTATLKKVKGIVSAQSLEALLQWIYIRRVIFQAEESEDQISAAIELTRLADMCTVTSLESKIARQIKEIIQDNPESDLNKGDDFNRNTYFLTTKHVRSAILLPEGHKVRQVLAEASVDGYLRDETHKFKEEVQAFLQLGADVLQKVRKALNTLSDSRATFEDPISGERLTINTFDDDDD